MKKLQRSFLGTWLLAVRPKTLTAAIVPILVGTTLAYATHGRFRLDLSLFALISALLIQVGTNFINDALDFERGADTADRLGPKRVAQSGLLSSRSLWWGGILAFSLAAIPAIPLVNAGGWPILLIGIFSIIAGYVYTGGPYPLAYTGLGDVFVLIFFGWVAVGGIYYLNSGTMDMNGWVAGTQVGLLATVLIAINNFRDHVTDRQVNKKTLAVRWGPQFARWEIALLCFLPFAGAFFWFFQGLPWASFLPLGIFPLAQTLVRKIHTVEPNATYNRFLAQAAALHLGFGLLLSMGLFLR